ncbi:putative signal transducing protein [Shewanella sp. A14]
MEQRKVLLVGGNLLQAHTWKGLLETSGIDVDLKGEALIGGVGGLPIEMQTVELWVTDSQLTAAQTILDALDIKQPQWQCVQCHEINEGSFELCWQCSSQKSEMHNE